MSLESEKKINRRKIKIRIDDIIMPIIIKTSRKKAKALSLYLEYFGQYLITIFGKPKRAKGINKRIYDIF